jgi:hypothetical protein
MGINADHNKARVKFSKVKTKDQNALSADRNDSIGVKRIVTNRPKQISIPCSSSRPTIEQ